MHRRKINRINALHNKDGDWLYDPDEIQSEVVNYFQQLYWEKPSSIGSLPPISDDESKKVSDDELKKALSDMAPLKALESDGYHAMDTICKWVKEFFNRRPIDQDLNNTLIVLIPKTAQPIRDFTI
ncbi:tyrosine decarboxylase 1-like [Gossypium australe]|uniref:Tyrosine decarboxylase 1-like n=1 Tax=Gossypium australe TaxID=47621 RepID=A0A5B6WUD0_9ROSI|nr:tyrosine decarboxylase 1-like [Gossypium australe]